MRPRARAGWRERIRAGLAALLRFLDEEPALGRLCVVEALGAGPQGAGAPGAVHAALIARSMRPRGGRRGAA